MTIEHSGITDPNIHEPKGAAAANAGEVYMADGAGSGDWTNYRVALVVRHTDAANTTSVNVVAPIAGTIIKIWSVISAAFDADTVFTPSINGSNITDGTITVTASGSAASDVDSCTPIGANVVAAGDVINIASDGAGTTVGNATFTIVITPS